MKRIICFILILLITNNLLAQGMRVGDLVKMPKMDKSEIEGFLNNKNFAVEDIRNDKYHTTIIYVHYAPKYWVGISDFIDGCKNYHCDFSNTNFYNLQNKEAIQLGFKYLKLNIREDNVTSAGN